MPTYEYHCDACEHEFEEFQSITASPLRKCPACGKPKLRRLFGTGAAVLFRGSGFYQTDYRSEGYKKAAKAEQEAQKAPAADKAATNGTSAAGGPAGASKAAKKSSKSARGVSDD